MSPLIERHYKLLELQREIEAVPKEENWHKSCKMGVFIVVFFREEDDALKKTSL